MIKFQELDKTLQDELNAICNEDPYNLNAESLYINIVHSKGSTKMLSILFELPEELIKKIKEKNEKQDG